MGLLRLQYDAEVFRSSFTIDTPDSIYPWFRTGVSQADILTMTTVRRTAAEAAAAVPTGTATAPTAGYYLTGWTPVPQAIYTKVPPYNGDVFSVPVDANGLTGIRVLPGQYVAVRFSNINDTGGDSYMGIDNLVMTFGELSVNLSPVVTNIVRDNSGTPDNSADDRVNFTLTVNATGAPGPGWRIVSPASFAASGPYAVPVNITGVPIAEFAAGNHAVTGVVQDTLDPASSASFVVTAP